MITRDDILNYSKSHTIMVYYQVRRELKTKYPSEFVNDLVSPIKEALRVLKTKNDEKQLLKLKAGLIKMVRLCKIPFVRVIK